MKYGGGSMLGGCFSAEGPGRFVRVKGRINTEKYIGILEKFLMPSVGNPSLGIFFFQ